MNIGGSEEQTMTLPRADSVVSEATVSLPQSDYRAFGIAKESFERQHLFMLEVQLRTGNRILFPYYKLGRVDWNPSREMTLSFGEELLVLKGRNLLGLFSALREQKVAWVAEADHVAAELALANVAVVESIKVEPRVGIV